MSFMLMPSLVLNCGLEPETLVNYTTRWVLPGGEIIDSSTGRLIVSQNMVSINSRTLPGAILAVFNLSYQDAGTYTCEGRSTVPGASAQWASASFELHLSGEFILYSVKYHLEDSLTFSGTII